MLENLLLSALCGRCSLWNCICRLYLMLCITMVLLEKEVFFRVWKRKPSADSLSKENFWKLVIKFIIWSILEMMEWESLNHFMCCWLNECGL